MNIATYTTPLSIGASPTFALSLLRGTLTWVNAKQLRRARLTLLSESHLPLVTLFGRSSGRDVDKVASARDMGFAIGTTTDGVPFLEDAQGYVDLHVEDWVECGEHELAICSTEGFTELGDGGGGRDAVMTTAFLREKGVMDAL